MKSSRDVVILDRRFVPKDALIVEQGELGATAFLIQSGSVRVYTEGNGKLIELGKLGLGQIFGEMALIFDGPRTATVQALEDCNLIVITRDVLNEKLEKSDPTIRAIVPMLTKRILQSNNALLQGGDTVQDMIAAVEAIYQNMYIALPADQKAGLEATVLPQLQAFLTAIREFGERNKS